MSVQMLCGGSGDAATLIDKDPQLAAIVLRWLAPQEFVRCVGQNIWQKALPSLIQ